MRDRLELSHRAAHRVREALALHPDSADRGRRLERGEGGDMTMVLDRVAEEAVLAELEASGEPLTAISEERGEIDLNGGGPPFVVIDPVDGSLNAKRRLPFHALSVAFAGGRAMSDVDFGYVFDLSCGEEWGAERGGGAFVDGRRLPAVEGGEAFGIGGIGTGRPALSADNTAGIGALPPTP